MPSALEVKANLLLSFSVYPKLYWTLLEAYTDIL
jgi:hypothetical protein